MTMQNHSRLLDHAAPAVSMAAQALDGNAACAHGSALPEAWLNAAEPMLPARDVVWVTIAIIAATVAVLVTGA